MIRTLTCVIVDDEPLAQRLLDTFIRRVPYLSLTASYDNAITALDGIRETKPDIVFLDIHMPEMSGIYFLRTLSANRPHIIMTTAYPQYALEGFEYAAVDYLLKPIAFARFMQAIGKVLDRLPLTPEAITGTENNQSPAPAGTDAVAGDAFFLVKEDKRLVNVSLADILYVEGMRDYVKIHLPERFIITHLTMNRMAEHLPPARFIRINRSFIVQIPAIRAVEGNQVEVRNGARLPIGVNFRESVREALKAWMI
jgi:two-component system, LytTR family, response regulator